MTYEVKLTVLIKTMGKQFTHSQMRNAISEQLWNCEEFRDIQIIDYEADTLEDPNPFSDIRQQILEES